MATRVYSSKAKKSDEDPGPHSHPKPKSETGGRSLSGIMGKKPSTERERGRRKMAGVYYPKPKSKPESVSKHTHPKSPAPKGAPLAPEAPGRASAMTKSKSKKGPVAGRSTKKKKQQLKRSKAWAKRYASGGSDDRG